MLMKLLLACSIIGSVYGMGFLMQERNCPEGVAKCEEGFKLFKKKDGHPWCVKLVIGNVSWWDAEKTCRCQYNATLSGLETSAEVKWLEAQALEEFGNASIKNGAIWIGSYRREACNGPASGFDVKLCGNEKIFQFTDRKSCSTYIYQQWAPGFPANTVQDGKSVENCGQILISTEDSGANADLSTLTSNKDCLQVTSPNGDIYSSRGFICGKEAEFEQSGGDYYGNSGLLIGAGKPKTH